MKTFVRFLHAGIIILAAVFAAMCLFALPTPYNRWFFGVGLFAAVVMWDCLD